MGVLGEWRVCLYRVDLLLPGGMAYMARFEKADCLEGDGSHFANSWEIRRTSAYVFCLSFPLRGGVNWWSRFSSCTKSDMLIEVGLCEKVMRCSIYT